MFPTLPAALAHHAQTIPDQRFTRILKGGQPIADFTFAQMWHYAGQWAALFIERGLTPGDIVLLALHNTHHFVGAYYGCLIAGLAPAPLAPLRRLEPDAPYLQTVINRYKFTNAKALIVPDDQLQITNYQLLEGVNILCASQLDPSQTLTEIRSTPASTALIQFTSGTSGQPKAVVLSQHALVAQVTLLRDRLQLQDRFIEAGVSWLPLFHDMGLIGFLLTPGYAGGTINLMQPEDFVLRPTAWLKALTEYKATVTGGPPSAYALVAKRVKDADLANYDLSSVRVALIGAEMVTRESVTAFCDKFQSTGFRPQALLSTYGLAENSLAVTMPPLFTKPQFDTLTASALAQAIAQPAPPNSDPALVRSFASVGAPLPDTLVRIVDDHQQPLPERHIGEIAVQSPSLMSGYLIDPHTALPDGWLYTGDLGYMAEGNLYVTGRKKELIIVGGRNYYPDDVEQLVNTVPGVRMDRAVAIGVEDSGRATERLVVLTETERTESADRAALQLAIRQTLLAADYPISEVTLLKPKSIQSTLTGKLKRLDCKARYLAGEFSINN
jgi:fatty-acyl-CoA synthase